MLYTSSDSAVPSSTQANGLMSLFPPPSVVTLSFRLQAILLGVLAFVMAFIVLSFCSSVSEHCCVATRLLLTYMHGAAINTSHQDHV